MPSELENGEIIADNRQLVNLFEGITCRCAEGYKISGENSIEKKIFCQRNGEWNSQPTCESK